MPPPSQWLPPGRARAHRPIQIQSVSVTSHGEKAKPKSSHETRGSYKTSESIRRARKYAEPETAASTTPPASHRRSARATGSFVKGIKSNNEADNGKRHHINISEDQRTEQCNKLTMLTEPNSTLVRTKHGCACDHIERSKQISELKMRNIELETMQRAQAAEIEKHEVQSAYMECKLVEAIARIKAGTNSDDEWEIV